MPIKEIIETKKRWSFLSKIDILGSLDFWTLIISLDSLKSNDTDNINLENLNLPNTDTISFNEYESYAKVLTLSSHEYTHFIDATSTVWGMQHLKKLDDCLNVDMNNEREYATLKKTYDYIRKIRLPDYYTTIEKSQNFDRPWRRDVTTGIMFNQDGSIGETPIVFVRFNNSKMEPLVRSPISIVSLLEANAMAKEIECRANLFQRLKKDEQIVEQKLFNEKILNFIYDPKLTEYSVCFHLLAKFQDEKDLANIAIPVSYLSRLVLNAPSIAFTSASKNMRSYAEKFSIPIGNIRIKRMEKALQLGNHGALFYLICLFLPINSLKNKIAFHRGVELSLRKLGLSHEKLRRAAHEEVSDCKEKLLKSTNNSIKILSEAGEKNFKLIYLNGFSLNFNELSLPPALLGDLKTYSFSNSENNLLKNCDLDSMYDELIRGQIQAENFSEACI